MPRRTKPGVNWTEIEQKVRAGQSTTSLAKEYDLARQSIDKRANKEGWRDGPQKWMPAVSQTNTSKALESPQTVTDRDMVTRGHWSPETQAAILYALSEGQALAQAAESNGISYEQFLRRRKADVIFDRLVAQARNGVCGEMQTEIVKSARRGDWKAAESFLKASPETRKDWSGNNAGAGGITVNIAIWGEDKQPIVDIAPAKDNEE